MRTFLAVSLVALLSPVAAMAQSSPAPAAAPPPSAAAPASPAPAGRNGDITRDEYVERAKANAERRFDRMDADHDGVLTADERRAYREAHHRQRSSAAH